MADAQGLKELIHRGQELAEAQQLDEALTCFDAALEQDPDHAPALFGMADGLIALERLPEALAAVERGLRSEPGWAAGWCNRGILLSRLGRDAEALECLCQAAELDPEAPEVHNNL